MIKIYGSKHSSAARCMWTMEELGIPYENPTLDIKNGENKKPPYLKLNPNGKIPTLVDGDFVLWESIAINNYLAEKSGSDLAGKTIEERALINQWSLWALIHLYGEGLHGLVMQKWRNEPENEASRHARAEGIPKWLGILEQHLEGKTYMVSERFTLADINVMSAVNSVHFVGFDISGYKNITKWMSLLGERPALKKLNEK